MKKYKITAISLPILMFFWLCTFEKIIAQTKWDFIDLWFAVAFCIMTGVCLYNYKNEL